MKAEKANYPVLLMCRVLGVSKSRFYGWMKQNRSQERAVKEKGLVEKIRTLHEKSFGTYGSPRIHVDLSEAGETVSVNRVARLMRKEGIVGCPKRRFRITTDSNHAEPVAENILKREFVQEVPNKVWVADITYIRTVRGWGYLSVILDLFNHEVVGWSFENHMRTELVLKSLSMALRRRHPQPGLIFHSDRGSVYASKDFRKALNVAGITQSMSRKGDCWDNACAESFFATIKRELVYRHHLLELAEARADIHLYIEVFYNRKRRHSSNGYLCPMEFERRFLAGAAVAA